MIDISKLSSSGGGLVIFAVTFLEQAGAPIPAAPCLLAAGALCATGEATAGPVIGAAFLGSLMADLMWFYAGRRGGKRVLNFLCRLGLLQSRKIEQTEKTFADRSMRAVILSKFVPGLSLVIPPLAGAFHIGFRRFLMLDSLASLLYAGLYLLLGVVFSDQVEAALKVLSHFGFGSLLILLALAVGYLVIKRRSRRAAAQPQ